MSGTAPRGGSNGLADTPEEELLIIHVAMAVLALLFASAGALWLQGSAWLVEHQVLVAHTAQPLVEVPGTAGAGFDLPRLAIAAGLVLAGLATVVSAARRAWRRGPEDLA